MSEPLQKFQSLLRELFEFDSADLDFGIYRIMNHKRQVVERFISEDLPHEVNKELNSSALAEQQQAHKALEEALAKVRNALGDEALDANGNLAETYRNTPAGKAYLEARARAEGSHSTEALEATIYNHLYTFFNRYWQEGDFISKRRYSKKERYGIPYNGEEVYLYWANHDQYYVKTGEYLTDYAFKAPNGVTVCFKLQQANVEQNNIKGEKRFFLPVLSGSTWEEPSRTLTMPFEFRPLTDQETITYGQKNQQEAIIAKAVAEIPMHVRTEAALAALNAERRRKEDGTIVSYLEHHLRQYARRNTSDFFIHKDLRGFLTRELDFYLKNEVLNLEEMETAGEELAEGWFQLMRLIKRVGNKIIDFLAQIEGFQKMLWEKRKFITESFYIITVGNIPEGFYREIAAKAAQWEEWRALGFVEREPEERLAFLKAHPTLPLDTRHFSKDFTDRLLGSFDNLDELTDGLLVHSENWQALNLLQEKYRERVKCIYIDPPYNTGNDAFIYKDSYRDSSWITFLDNRIGAFLPLAQKDTALFISIDDNEVGNLVSLIKNHSFSIQYVTLVTAQLNPRGRTLDKYLAKTHEYVGVFALSNSPGAIREITKSKEAQSEYCEKDEKGPYRLLELRNRNPVFNRSNRPNLFYTLFADPLSGTVRVEPDSTHTVEILPRNSREQDGCWTWSKGKAQAHIGELVARQTRAGTWRVFRKDRLYSENGTLVTTKAKTIWIDKDINNENGKELIGSLFGKAIFDFPKPTRLVERCAEIGMAKDGHFVDFFAGSGTSGHAIINLNRRDGGTRSFTLIEMGEYFDSVLLPRIKKVTFTPEWKDGKPKRMATAEEAERSPRIVKIMRLESYEDALNNLTFDEEGGQKTLELFKDDYLLHYMLKWETRRSETFLDVEKLQTPFSYKLRIYRDGETNERPVDLPETFNYLIGLDVRTRKARENEGRGYLVFHGTTREGRRTAVIWRETTGWTADDYKRDAEYIAMEKLTGDAEEVFINGDSVVPGARSLDVVFKERMFAG